MLSDINIKVHETAPSADELLLDKESSDEDDDASEEAVAALTAVNSEFGRTTDPVRMYMREMGTVELLTRQGEIAIAKRIEEGIQQVLATLASSPEIIGSMLADFDKFLNDEMRLTDIITGFVADDEDQSAAASGLIASVSTEDESDSGGSNSTDSGSSDSTEEEEETEEE